MLVLFVHYRIMCIGNNVIDMRNTDVYFPGCLHTRAKMYLFSVDSPSGGPYT